MKILVCVKQVPDMQSDFRVDESGAGYDESGLVFRINSYDEYALEEAARIKETRENVHISALSVGPERAGAAVRRGIEFGTDHGVHILTEERLDALETASLIVSYAKGRKFDLLLFGVMAEDDQRSQVGPMVAALLDLPYTTTVIKENISSDKKSITVERELEGGRREALEMPLPAALTVQSGINVPRYPSLSNKLRAKKQALEVINASDLPRAEKCEQLERVYPPPPVEGGVILSGTLEEQAERLIAIIHEKTNLL